VVSSQLGTALRSVTATRYVTPLREGGSLPGLMEADDLGYYVVKFTGAGQGRKALVAEVICAALARSLGLPVPDLVTVELDPILAYNEPDEEVQALIRASAGRNLGVDFLPGSLDLDVGAFPVDAEFAGRVLWFDALVGNVDRSWRNPNMLFWHGQPYLIDHGAALTFHHSWSPNSYGAPFDASEHALLGCSPNLEAAARDLAPLVTAEVLQEATAAVPDEWLEPGPGLAAADDVRAAYVERILARLTDRETWQAELAAALEGYDESVRTTPRRRNRPTWLGGDR